MNETQRSIQRSTRNKMQVKNYEFTVQEKPPHPRIVDMLESVGGKIALGPAPSFNEAHVVKVLEILGDYGTVGRIKLSDELEMGIGTTRTILKHLKNEGLIYSSKKGFMFSEQGKDLFANLRNKISAGLEVPNSPLTVGPVVIAVLVRGMAHNVRRGVEQRNSAIRAGASGATTLVFSRNRLTMASKREHIIECNSEVQNIILTKLNPKENDVIIIGSGESKIKAENGAIMAALKLIKSEKASEI
jgi:predicted transcriptional regulator